MILELSFPPPELSPNARPFWAVKHKVRKAYREECARLAKSARLALGPYLSWPLHAPVLLELRFLSATKRRRDRDNLIAWFKTGIDGLVDGGILADDSAENLVIGAVEVEVARKPQVVVTLHEMGGEKLEHEVSMKRAPISP
jgi:crossover junction endodeoxyribonuclease RusA